MQPNEPQTPQQLPADPGQQQAPIPPQPQAPAQPVIVPPTPLPPAGVMQATPQDNTPSQPQVQPTSPVAAFAPAETMYAPQEENNTNEAAPQSTSSVGAPTELPEIQPVTWQAQEYQQYDKTPVWYIVLGVIVLLLVAGGVLLKAWTLVLLVPVMAVALVMYTHRPPRTLNYAVSNKGVYIGDILHPIGDFKAFSVYKSSGPQQHQLVLIPVKRFRPSMTLLFPTEVGEQLVDIIGAYLPSQPYKPDIFDSIIKRLRI